MPDKATDFFALNSLIDTVTLVRIYRVTFRIRNS
jgi:hypothetical protein